VCGISKFDLYRLSIWMGQISKDFPNKQDVFFLGKKKK